ncbi:hypothetical protein Acica_29c [Acidovorax phage Acica]|nr:hypothetical protein Acica_29c [Acidovorax phage Acica]
MLSVIGWALAALAALLFAAGMVGFIHPPAMKDPKTGAPPKRSHMFFLAWLGPVLPGAIAFSLLMTAADATPPAVVPAAQLLAPEMVVQLSAHPQFACLSEGHLQQAVEHSALGERTKFEAMFSGGACIVIPAEDGARFKVLAIRRNAVEFTSVDNPRASNGLWAVASAFRPS